MNKIFYLKITILSLFFCMQPLKAEDYITEEGRRPIMSRLDESTTHPYFPQQAYDQAKEQFLIKCINNNPNRIGSCHLQARLTSLKLHGIAGEPKDNIDLRRNVPYNNLRIPPYYLKHYSQNFPSNELP